MKKIRISELPTAESLAGLYVPAAHTAGNRTVRFLLTDAMRQAVTEYGGKVDDISFSRHTRNIVSYVFGGYADMRHGEAEITIGNKTFNQLEIKRTAAGGWEKTCLWAWGDFILHNGQMLNYSTGQRELMVMRGADASSQNGDTWSNLDRITVNRASSEPLEVSADSSYSTGVEMVTSSNSQNIAEIQLSTNIMADSTRTMRVVFNVPRNCYINSISISEVYAFNATIYYKDGTPGVSLTIDKDYPRQSDITALGNRVGTLESGLDRAETDIAALKDGIKKELPEYVGASYNFAEWAGTEAGSAVSNFDGNDMTPLRLTSAGGDTIDTLLWTWGDFIITQSQLKNQSPGERLLAVSRQVGGSQIQALTTGDKVTFGTDTDLTLHETSIQADKSGNTFTVTGLDGIFCVRVPRNTYFRSITFETAEGQMYTLTLTPAGAEDKAVLTVPKSGKLADAEALAALTARVAALENKQS